MILKKGTNEIYLTFPMDLNINGYAKNLWILYTDYDDGETIPTATASCKISGQQINFMFTKLSWRYFTIK